MSDISYLTAAFDEKFNPSASDEEFNLFVSDEEFNPSDVDSEETLESTSTIAALQTTNDNTSNKTSPVWKFMYKEMSTDGTTVIVCNNNKCRRQYSIKTSTGI